MAYDGLLTGNAIQVSEQPLEPAQLYGTQAKLIWELPVLNEMISGTQLGHEKDMCVQLMDTKVGPSLISIAIWVVA